MTNLRVLRPAAPPTPVGAGAPARSLDDVYRSYCRYVGAVCLRISGRRAEVDDLIQDVFAEAASTYDALREPDAVRGWLATIAVRVTRRRLRRRRLYALIGVTAAAEYEQIADPHASPHERALIAAIYRVLDALDADDRIAFVLHHVEGETIDTVARLCACSSTTAKRRIFRAKSALERRLSDE
ncbi:MAG TPA: sigma-70 family RNA polymerase sigma factor [Polyangiaceae bacterium]|nr:sigma-70 family RNA polymerase sigma factor [Polyangiaceae bacterium]